MSKIAKKILSCRRSGILVSMKIDDVGVRRQIEKALTYQKKRFLQGREAQEAKRNGLPPVEFNATPCYYYDRTHEMVFVRGFLPTIRRLLKLNGFKLESTWERNKPKFIAPDWDNLFATFTDFRYRQKDVLLKMVASECGRIDCATGYGKSFLIICMALLYPGRKIDVVCHSAAVIKKIHAELVSVLGDVGLRGAGSIYMAPKINCFCAASLKYSKGDADFLFADEMHALAPPAYLEELVKYRKARMFGFSASQDMRSDGADFELQGLFGDVLISIPYQEAVSGGAIVDIDVHWYSDGGKDLSGAAMGIQLERAAIWRNRSRNRLVAEVAKAYASTGEQVLVYVTKVEHLLALRLLLPDFTAVYSETSVSPDRLAKFSRQGLVDDSFEPITSQSRLKLQKEFEAGTLKRVICTGVWGVGVSFNSLGVIIRADAGSSDTASVQVPGRVSRIDGKKTRGVLVDFSDGFNSTFRRRGETRRRSYARTGWNQKTCVCRRLTDGKIELIIRDSVNVNSIERLKDGKISTETVRGHQGVRKKVRCAVKPVHDGGTQGGSCQNSKGLHPSTEAVPF